MTQEQISLRDLNVTEESLDKEVDLAFLRKLSDKLAIGWERLGGELGLTDATLHNIKKNNRDDEGETKYQMLRTWKQRNGRDATFRILSEKLKAAGLKDLADAINTTSLR